MRGEYVSPCGACRQSLAEFDAPGASMDVFMVKSTKRTVKRVTLAQLLPSSFNTSWVVLDGKDGASADELSPAEKKAVENDCFENVDEFNLNAWILVLDLDLFSMFCWFQLILHRTYVYIVTRQCNQWAWGLIAIELQNHAENRGDRKKLCITNCVQYDRGELSMYKAYYKFTTIHFDFL